MRQALNLRQEVLKTCFGRDDTYFSSGAKANNKLDIELLQDNEELKQIVVQGLSKFVLGHNPEFVVGVPDGATWLADAVATRTGLHCVHLKRNKAQTEFATDVDRDLICEPLSRGVLIEDVFNKFTQTRRALVIPELKARIVAVEAVFDRGTLPRQNPSKPHHALLKEHIPAQLPEDSELWQFAG